MRKYLILLFFTLPFICKSQIFAVDKVAHAGVGFVSGTLTSSAVYSFGNGKNETIKAIGFGMLSGVTLGAGKELYDYTIKGAKFDVNDMFATIFGSVLGSLTIKLTVDFSRKRKSTF